MSARPIAWLFAPHAGNSSAFDIVAWWELRRVPFNLIVGSIGGCSLALFFLFISPSG
jgi:hypothetical protein